MTATAARLPLDGISAIEASAGTGKTFTITQLYLRLVVEHELDVAAILVVTYTNAATAELRRRIRERLLDAAAVLETGRSDDGFYQTLLARVRDRGAASRAVARALQAFDEAAVFTIHGFCQRVLAERAFESGVAFDAELVPDQDDLLLEVVDDFWRRHLAIAPLPLVRRLVALGWSPEWLRADVRTHLGRRFARVLRPPDPPDLGGLEGRVAAAFAALRTAWTVGRTAFGRLLAEAPLRRTRYRQDVAARIVGALDALVASGGPPERAREALERATSARLLEARTDPAWVPRDGVVACCDELVAALAARDTGYAARAVALRAALREFVESELAARKAERGIQFYDDLLGALARALCAPGRGAALAAAVRRRYPAALIDEFQDTDPVQYEIVHAIYGGGACPVVLVGDPKQAIYSFRGADVFSYLRARDHARSVDRLDRNWRADPPLVHAVNAIFGARARPFVLDGIPFVSVEPAPRRDARVLAIDDRAAAGLRIWWLSEGARPLDKGVARERAARATAGEIARLLALGRAGRATLGGEPLAGGHLAVLVRTNDEGRRMREVLLEHGVPSVQQAVDSVFASREAAELERVLLAVADPGQAARVRAALATEMLGHTADDLERLAADDARWDDRIETFHEYHHRWLARGFVSMMRDLLVRERVSERLLAFPDGERRLTNLGHLVELLQAASMRRGGGADPLVEWLADARGGVREAEVTPDQHLLRLESDAGLVQIVTVHKAKGLQYPIVFCPFLWEGRLRAGRSEDVVFHAPDAEGATLDLGTTGGAGHRRLACAEELAERLRLLYVALTRAEHRCYLVWGKVKDGGGAPLAWLFHAGDEQAPLEAVAERYGRLDAAALLAEVQEVARRAGGAIAVERIPEEGRVRVMPSAPTAEQLAPRTLRHPVRAPWAIASFSALVAADEELERRDFDQMDEQPGEAVSRLDVHGFPRGARAGRCLHAILEAVDFLSPERAVVDRTLAAFGIAPEWGPVVAEWLDRILATPLDASGLRLGTVPRSRRVDELEFHYPAREVEVVRLARALAEAGFAGGAFVDAAARLPPRTPAGFLKGFIDCVFEHEGRFFVLDYKSNRLGDGPDAYTAAALVPAMARGQYWLQYLVYVVAVHRWLGRRLVGYDYDRHFGGVRYLFLRGMDPVRGWGGGVYADRPSRGVIELLDAALAGQGG